MEEHFPNGEGVSHYEPITHECARVLRRRRHPAGTSDGEAAMTERRQAGKFWTRGDIDVGSLRDGPSNPRVIKVLPFTLSRTLGAVFSRPTH